MKNFSISILMLLAALVLFPSCQSGLPDKTGQIDIELFLGEGDKQPLLVGFGGSEGGNAWASERWDETRNRFIDEGYAFMAIGYFGSKTTPSSLDRIALDAIYDSIMNVAKRNPQIDSRRIAVVGGSKGGELALNLASRFEEISAVVAIVPGHASFPAHTLMAMTSSWSMNGEEVAYVPAPLRATPAMIKHDLHTAFSIMLEDELAVKNALIPVENINGSVLLVSATEDEMWPSTYMSDQIIFRLQEANFPHVYQHMSYEGDHGEPLNHFSEMIDFLNANFKNGK